MDKQIEEMEKDIAVRMAMAKGVAGSMNNGVEGWLSEYLVKMGWIKPTENAVVLTREEYEELQTGQDFNYGYHNGETNMTSYYENIRLPEIRKETAKEIFALLKSSEYVDSENTLSVWAIEKIIKERYGVEVE